MSLEKRSRVSHFAYAPFGWEFCHPYLLLVPGRLYFVTHLAVYILSSANGLGGVSQVKSASSKHYLLGNDDGRFITSDSRMPTPPSPYFWMCCSTATMSLSRIVAAEPV